MAPRPDRAARWRARSVAFCAGALLAAAFPPYDLPWLVIPGAVAGWFLLTRSTGLRDTLWLSLAFAMGFQLLLLRWIEVIGNDAWVVLALLEALFFLPVGAVRAVTNRSVLSVPLVAVAWPTMDWIRDHAGPLAFGWGQLAFASVDAPWASLAPVLPQWGITALIVAIAGAMALTAQARFAVRTTAAGVAVLALALPLLVASGDVPASSGIRVALVQAGVDHVGIGSGDRRAVMRRLAELTTAELRSTDVELIIWPENAVDVDPYHDAEARATVADASLAAGVPILFGALLESAEGRRNVSALQDGPHLNTVYVKQRLVPFGEVLPARDLLTRYTDRTRHLPIDFVPGAGPGTVTVGGLRLGIVICFEVADEGLVEAALRSGAVALIVQTNNATYAGLGQSEQQLRIAQYRAKSLRVPVLVISTNGPTAVIDVNGRIVRRIDEGGVGVLTADLPAARVRP